MTNSFMSFFFRSGTGFLGGGVLSSVYLLIAGSLTTIFFSLAFSYSWYALHTVFLIFLPPIFFSSCVDFEPCSVKTPVYYFRTLWR
jgi:hypothetical protein